MNAATAGDGTLAAPTPGDASVCLNCGQLLIFDEQLVLGKPTRAQVAKMMDDEKHWALIERLRFEILRRGRFHL